MTKDQVKQLWIDRGWIDLQSYYANLPERYKDNTYTIPELDGDVINPKTFWEAADEHFGTDGVCNSMYDPNAFDEQRSSQLPIWRIVIRVQVW